MRLKILLILTLTCLLNVQAQINVPANTPTINGYSIKFVAPKIEHKKVYLIGYEAGLPYCVDSASVKKGKASFKSKNLIPCGIYSFSYSPENRPFADIVLDKESVFTFTIADGKVRIEGSDENRMLYDFISSCPSDPKAIASHCQTLLETTPDAFISKFLMATNGADFQKIHNSRSQREMTETLLSVLDMNEPRLLYTPCRTLSLIDLPIIMGEITETDSILHYIQQIVQEYSATNIRNYMINKLFAALDNHTPDFDPALVYLYDHYDKSWINEGDEHRYQRKINNLRKLIPGASIPELISHDIDGKAHSSQDIPTKYTVLWFWDPDCDHCQEMTPVLHQIYRDYSEKLDFEVFAIEVNNDYDRWVTFSDKHELWDWTNLSTSMGEANMDFIEYFDIMTTPVIFLIDNSHNHTIIARQVTLNELLKKLSSQE